MLFREQREQLVRQKLDLYHKVLVSNEKGDQMALVMEKEQATTPLYLTAVVEELRVFVRNIVPNIVYVLAHTYMQTYLQSGSMGTVDRSLA